MTMIEPTSALVPTFREGALAVPHAEQEREREVARAIAQHARASNTRRCYDYAWRDWVTWCEERRLCPCPPDAESVATYLSSFATEGLSWSRARLAYCAIKSVLRAQGAPGWEANRGAPWVVQTQVAALRRLLRPSEKGKDPICLDDLERMLPPVDSLELGSLRDRAILLTLFWGAFRRSELVGLLFADVEWRSQGIILRLRRSKTDQEGVGRAIAIFYQDARPHLCACRALDAWLHVARIESGALFRRLDRARHAAEDTLTGGSIAQIVKYYATRAGIDASKVSGHSLRSGFVTTAALSGEPLEAIALQTGHASLDMVRRYVRRQDPFRGNATEHGSEFARAGATTSASR